MARIKTEDPSDLGAFNGFVKRFPELKSEILSYIGNQARGDLVDNFLSGQEIQLRAFPFDSARKQTTKSRVMRNRKTIVVTSYPVNLFEKGRMLRDGSFEEPKNIFSSKFKGVVASNVGKYSDKAVKKIFDDRIRKI